MLLIRNPVSRRTSAFPKIGNEYSAQRAANKSTKHRSQHRNPSKYASRKSSETYKNTRKHHKEQKTQNTRKHQKPQNIHKSTRKSATLQIMQPEISWVLWTWSDRLTSHDDCLHEDTRTHKYTPNKCPERWRLTRFRKLSSYSKKCDFFAAHPMKKCFEYWRFH